jgi:predicted solute-binding protein
MVEAHPELIQAHSGLEQVDAGAVVHSGVIEASKGLNHKREIGQKWLEPCAQGVVLLMINVVKLPDTSGILTQSFSELL